MESVHGAALASAKVVSDPCQIMLPSGAQVDVVVGFSNGGEEAYNVTALIGSLHSSAQWNLWVQNFTAQVGCHWPTDSGRAGYCAVPVVRSL